MSRRLGVLVLLLGVQLAACGSQPPVSCAAAAVRPHPEVGGELLFTCYSWPAVKGGLYLLDVATGSVRPLTSDGALNLDADWSPDGGRIAYQSTRDGRSDLYLTDLSDGRVRRLTNGSGFNEYPRWSPDGSWISFTSSRAGVQRPFGAAGFHRDVYLMRPDGTAVRRLTSLGGVDADAAWSPDGSRLVFNSDRGGAFDLYTMTPDGQDQRQLTHHEGRHGYASYPGWSPDGSEIVYDASNSAGDSAAASIYRMAAGGGEARRVTHGFDYRPDWSPDGSWIAFVGKRRGHTQLFVVRPDGTDLTQLTTGTADKDLPRWRPG